MNYAIILAAGKGSRMKTELPKCAVELFKKPMVEYIVDALERTEIDKRICVVGHKSEVIVNILKDRVEYAYQIEQLGTADAVKSAIGLIKGEGYSLILPGDTPLIDEEIIDNITRFHKESKNDISIATAYLDKPKGFGRIIRDGSGNVVSIVEEIEANKIEKEIKEINTGIYCIENKMLIETLDKIKCDNNKGEYYLTDIIKLLASQVKIGTYLIKDVYKVSGINDLYALSKVEESLRNVINKKHMQNGVEIINPETVTISPDVIIDKGVIIYPGSLLMGKSVIGENSIIGPNTELYNAVIEENVVCRHSVIYDSRIKKGASVGPFTHLRMNSIVGENNRIGNFVELKKSTLGYKTNVAHLTYIGDTTCGDEVNFGCGTVTVNYDGKNKFKTNIGNRVFIGCNSNLIAPLNIGSDVYIAAGSTINQDLIDEDFAIARVRQIVKHNYANKYGYKKSKL